MSTSFLLLPVRRAFYSADGPNNPMQLKLYGKKINVACAFFLLSDVFELGEAFCKCHFTIPREMRNIMLI